VIDVIVPDPPHVTDVVEPALELYVNVLPAACNTPVFTPISNWLDTADDNADAVEFNKDTLPGVHTSTPPPVSYRKRDSASETSNGSAVLIPDP
jgi:hypothetical protein